MSKKTESPAEPKKKVLYTLSLTPEQAKALQIWCDRQLWIPHKVEYAQFAFKGDGVNVVMYTSGKLVVQGKKTEEFVTYVLEGEITKDPRLGYDAFHHPEWFEAHGGLDESGKGDLFGPIVSACVLVDAGVAQTWLDMGIRDSKTISSNAEIFRFETLIRKTQGVVVQTTFANMRRYNELYVKFSSNLNKLLAWMHAKSLGEGLKLKRVPWVMLDQFTKQPLVQNYFKDEKNFELRMATKAEADPIVAAASIVARATYIRQLEKLSEQAGEELLKGASRHVQAQAQRLVQRLGKQGLHDFAKMHFRTALEACGETVPEKTPWARY